MRRLSRRPPVEAPALVVAGAPVDPLREPPIPVSYAIPKSVFGSGGGPKISTSYRLQGTSGQATGTGTLGARATSSAPGIGTKPACPLTELTAAPDISVDGSIVTLTWDAVAGASTYTIYRSAESYFASVRPTKRRSSTVWIISREVDTRS